MRKRDVVFFSILTAGWVIAVALYLLAAMHSK
jgi:hypothetical protein